MITCYIGLGSNQQEPLFQLQQACQALAELPDSRLLACSSAYSSSPLGPQDQPDYLNAVACLQTRLEPLALLDALQAIEQHQGRIRKDQRWGPRTLDLDLLLYGDQQIEHARLQVPHYHMHTRDFVLRPLLELQPDLHLPDGSNLQQFLAHCADHQLQVKTVALWPKAATDDCNPQSTPL
ncbi:MAG: 2-amino-4-hydroxy-6-hydroxymethyldihydropteridine diphosphokinase [Halopseudomonas yangmingensis]|uniref:2-amino-4-hydroxy-6-hydroxymethyldihydropteridine pyrophosphokinase n=1 Tax=Halopseudomonas yangmingensis TaxID=1720063 RepID=A0A1I4TPY0_9GAMM|nr:2-amino-4-hydroxy-6-hydroxymethyldihydropteridine diphosphokinase [Halopseudomonas yangmingensis]SFM78736.1 2-amino-4-hydroxy-6-hydroxymethyldihydropteridinediphosphokinase [Halopseudomonas yangmingensis]